MNQDFNWDDSRIFLALAREGTLSGAAKHLHTGIATVSRRIERMENALGIPLFLRHQSGYRLTDQGAAMLPRIEAIELAALNMQHQVEKQSGIEGFVRVACFESLITPFIIPALTPLLGDNPGLDIELVFHTSVVNIHRHDADLALRMIWPERGNLLVRQLASMGFGLYGADEKTPSQRFITWPEMEDLTLPLAWSRAFGAMDGPRLAVNTLNGQLEAVRKGIGRAVLPHFLARKAGLHLISNTLPNGKLMQRPVYLVTHANLAASRRVQTVSQAISDEITERRVELSDP
ncbi:transcriptional regulator, LysR family [Cohaesibacter sp. ES.047]|uniref:LysR family transcriptional regulator n=1 Tax=Cohaesibacter sp. ES.047 TaxID=1798205 RepID=UPI000BB85009|nr:LysR family transcriptional regulator [Cohaesibacter sp. ES.047]SNY90539.1 transcriptional regulator, LysR family [Cohaesibacter sp. ES.047]